MKLTVRELITSYHNNQLKPTDVLIDCLKEVKAPLHSAAINHIILNSTIAKNVVYKKQSLLSGVPYALKDNIATADYPTSSSSPILKDFFPNYDAKVYADLAAAGAVLVAKSVLDELGMGGTGTCDSKGILFNPYNKQRVVGGSSSGSCWLVAKGVVPFAIATDTGDSIRKPASFNCLYGIKPTWGLVSRYGLFSFAPSFDTIGVIARSPVDCGLVLKSIAKPDERDMTNNIPNGYNIDLDNLTFNHKTKKIAVLRPLLDQINHREIKKNFLDLVDFLKAKNIQVDIIEFDEWSLRVLLVIYQILTFAEAMSSNRCITGTLFGNKIQKDNWFASVCATRSQFLIEVKKRFLIGAFSLAKENIFTLFDKARSIRNFINHQILHVLSSYDGILHLTQDGPPPLISEVTDEFRDFKNEVFTSNCSLMANFAGLPSISFPYGFLKGHLPYGFSLTTNLFDEQFCLQFAQLVASKTKLVNQVAP